MIIAVGAGLGAPLLVLVLVQLVTIVSGWLGVARTSAKAIGHAGHLVRVAYRIRPVRLVSAVLITIIVPLAQALMVGVCYLAGNAISASVIDTHPLNQAFTATDVVSARTALDALLQSLQFDSVSGSYTLLVTGLMGASYRYAMNDKALKRIARCVALPGLLLLLPVGFGIILVVLGTAFIAFVSLLAWLADSASDPLSDASEFWAAAVPIVAVTAVLGIFVLSCHAAVYASRSVIRAWRILPEVE